MTVRVEMRMATLEDFAAVGAVSPLGTLRGYALLFDGNAVGVASIRYSGRERPLTASVDVLPQARTYPVAFHRWALKAKALAKGLGVATLTAIADPAVPRACAWLKRLGFDYVGESTVGGVWRCKL